MFKSQMIGHLGQDATVKQVNGTQQVAIQFSVAHSERWKDNQGVARERTTWVECTYWRMPDRVAVAEYLKKGQLVYLEGTVTANSYLSKETGEMQQKLALRVDKLELLGSSSQKASQPQQQQAAAQPQTQAQQQGQGQAAYQQQAYNPQQQGTGPAALTYAGQPAQQQPPTFVDNHPPMDPLPF